MAGIQAQESLVRRQMRILNMSEKDKKSIIEQRIFKPKNKLRRLNEEF